MNGKSSKMRAWAGIALVLAMLPALCIAVAAQDTANDWVKKGDDLMNSMASESLTEALNAYDKALQMDPQNESVLLSKTVVLEILKGQTATEALGIVENKLEKNPQDTLAWQARGAALSFLGIKQEANQSFEKAIEIYDQEIQKDPKNGTAWWYKAENLANLQRFEEALIAYEKVIELDHPRKVDALSAKGGILMQYERLEDSIIALDKATELDPNHFLSWATKGQALKEMGRNAESEAAYAKARELVYKG
jgi:superkiller protein 3